MVTEKKETALITKHDALPATFEELSGMAKAFVASGMFQDTKQLSQAIVKIQAGRELGLPPVYSMQNINLIRNRLTTSANTMAMLVKKSGRYNYRIKEHHDKSCSITFYERDGDKWVDVGESTFTIEDAKRADLIKPESGWVKYPRAMLFSRAISQGARLYCPDAIGGVYTDEEIRSIPARPEDSDIDTTINIGPKPEFLASVDVDIKDLWPGSETSSESTGAVRKPSGKTVNSNPPAEGKTNIIVSKGVIGQDLAEKLDKRIIGYLPDTGKRDPSTLKTLEQLAKALKEDFGLSYAEQWKELNISSWTDLAITPAEAYAQIAGTLRKK